MEFVQGQKEYHSDDNQEDQEEEEDQEDQVNKHNHIITSKFSSTSSSSSYNNAPSSNYKASTVVLPHYDHHHHHLGDQKSWVGSSQAAEAINFTDLSLRNAKEMDHDRIIQANFGSSNGGGGGGDNSSSNWPPNDEREHMFDKVVTPSDVGKLNRLVIPKQHAEKYFPLDSSSNEKGLLLNFQDRTGKPWRFRYSYWNSSQSYVMTKGWSRFVKEKKLDAGDIVSFERGVGESGKDFLYIDWRRRPPPPPPPPQPLISPLQFVNNQQTVRVGGSGRVLYSLQRPPPSSISMPLRHHDHFHQQHFNYNNIHPYHHQQHQHQHQYQYQQNYHHHHHQLQHQHGGLIHDPHHGGLGNIERLRGGGGDHVIHHPMVIDSVPAFVGRHGKISTNTGTNANYTNTSNSTTAAAAAKRLRLFGVNMEYQEPDDDECHQILSSSAIPHVTVASLSHHLPSSSLTPLELRLPTGPIDLSKRAKPTSLSFYLDP